MPELHQHVCEFDKYDHDQHIVQDHGPAVGAETDKRSKHDQAQRGRVRHWGLVCTVRILNA